MSVVVRMEMPISCFGCPFMMSCMGKIRCSIDRDRREGDLAFRPDWCPIICSLPEGHGRLVDADALLRDIEQYHVSDGRFQHWLELQSTIVLAERSETCLD